MKYTKKDIECLAQEVMHLLESDDMMIDVCVYWNGKRATYDYGYRDGKRILFGWKIEEGYDPHDYFEYASYQHILSLSFEGDLYYKYNDFDYEYPAMDKILQKYGLYSELGNSWNWSAFPIDDIEEYEYTDYRANKKPEPKAIYWHTEDAPKELLDIRDWWREASRKYGDSGSCVIGVGFTFTYKGEEYRMAAASPWQGNLSWESHKDDVAFMLKLIGCENVVYDWGIMD